MAEPLWRLSAAVKAQPASAIPPTKGIKAIRLMTTTWPNQLFERNAQVMASPYPNGLGVVVSSVAKLGLDHRSNPPSAFCNRQPRGIATGIGTPRNRKSRSLED